MAHVNYAFLRGRPTVIKPAPQGNPHLWLLVRDDDGTDHFATINVQSSKGAPGSPVAQSYLYFLVDDDFRHPVLGSVLQRPSGMADAMPSQAAGALDYVKGDLLDPRRMRVLPPSDAGSDDLVRRLSAQLSVAQDAGHELLIFGSRFQTNKGQTDAVLGSTPADGIDNIHMAQGDPPDIDRKLRENGAWHDGGMFVLDRAGGRVTAVFLAFQTQHWQTDADGQPLDGSTGYEPPAYDLSAGTLGPLLPSPATRAAMTSLHRLPDAGAKLVIADMTGGPLDLGGWTVSDGAGSMAVDGTASPAAPLVVDLDPALVHDEGGILTLFDPDGLKVDGSAYLGGGAGAGWSTSFDL